MKRRVSCYGFLLVFILLLGGWLNPANAQQATIAITVTNTPANITTDSFCASNLCYAIVIRENSANPSATFSITPAGSSTEIILAPGSSYEFDSPSYASGSNFKSGQVLGTIVATTSGPFTFIAIENTARTSGANGLRSPPFNPAAPGCLGCTTPGPGTFTDLNAISLGFPGFPTSGLIGQYKILPTETVASLVDYSGAGNGAKGTTGTAPTIIATTGGLACGGAGAVVLPTAMNAAQDVFVYLSINSGIGSLGTFGQASPFMGIGTGGNSATAAGVQLFTYNTNVGSIYSPIIGGWQPSYTAATDSYQGIYGKALLEWVLNTGHDQYFINGQETAYYNTASTGSQGTNGGGYQICGRAAFTSGLAVATWWPGNVYYVLAYNRVLTTAERAQVSNFVTAQMQNRGIASNPITYGPGPISGNELLLIGDSITNETGTSQNKTYQYPNNLLPGLTQGTTALNAGISSTFLSSIASAGIQKTQPLLPVNARVRAIQIWMGSNDCGSYSETLIQNAANAIRQVKTDSGIRVILGTMLSRGSSHDACKNSLDTAFRLSWRTMGADALADFASDPNMGADGAYASTTYFQDSIHPTWGAESDDTAPIMQRVFNYVYGNQDWSSATTYTSGAPAATAITAASESTNMVTITSTLNPPVGSCAIISGVTPSDYNSPTTGGCWNVLTTSATNFTFLHPTSGLGAGSVFGTVAVPLQKDVDVYTILGGSSSTQSFTMVSCEGLTGQPRYFLNTDTNAWTLTAYAPTSELINGSSTYSLAAGASIILTPALTSSTAGGCGWVTTQ